ncbi:MAG: hypothetical protein B7X33_03055, partial [Lysobacterales bacterium 13-68-4]
LPDLTLHLSAQEEPLPPDLRGLDAALLIGAAPWPADWRVTTLAPEPLVTDDLAAGRLIAPWGFVDTAAAWVLVTPARANATRAAALAEWLAGELASPRPTGTA